MVAYANAEALAKTRATGRATFFSRSRNALWEKGATSGNTLAVKRVLVDCDEDALVYVAAPAGPTCHTGAPSCFFRDVDEVDELAELATTTVPSEAIAPNGATGGAAHDATALGRLESALLARRGSTAEKSYTKSLYEAGPRRIGEKIREEADELARALEGETDARAVSEAADVVYHVMVGLAARGIAWREVLAELEKRGKKSGHEEKASRRADP